jgi:hypothetical protein
VNHGDGRDHRHSRRGHPDRDGSEEPIVGTPLGKQRRDSLVTDRVAGNEKTTIGIIHQVGAFGA